MAEIKILIEGKHKKREDGKLEIGSTVSLIKSDKIILVDTGSFKEKDSLLQKLKEEEISLEGIDYVILTHLHLDHISNINLFPNSKILCKFRGGEYPGQIHDIKEGVLERFDLRENKLAEDVEVIFTPGHSEDMISVIVKTDKGKVVICGDSISDKSWASEDKVPLASMVFSLEEYRNSRKKILEVADYIVPGHGGMFKV
jgi:glyoxylase-like metal-dependent hydrolase (beta-lactamase superfamily II)